MKKLYEEHEAEILAGRAPLNTEGMDEAQAREALNADYNERRAIIQQLSQMQQRKRCY